MCVDLRYQCLLTEEKKKIAQEHLLATWRRIRVMRNDEDIAPVADDQTPTSLDPFSSFAAIARQRFLQIHDSAIQIKFFAG